MTPVATLIPDNWQPDVRGSIKTNVDLGPLTWFKVGGKADLVFRPQDAEDLAAFLKQVPEGVPVTVIGAASNLLVRDGGIRGIVIRFGRGFNEVMIDGDVLTAGCAVTDVTLAKHAQKAGLGGLEFFSGIPGTIGGAVRMNAGAFGGETCDALIDAQVLMPDLTIQTLSNDDLGFEYRKSALPTEAIVLSARFKAEAEEAPVIAERMAVIQSQREEAQPQRVRTGGSTFKNPPGQKAWQLIDEAGCRGFTVGGAMMSEKHCNFMINKGDATAADLEMLGEEVRKRVKSTSGVELHWEIRIIGDAPTNTSMRES